MKVEIEKLLAAFVCSLLYLIIPPAYRRKSLIILITAVICDQLSKQSTRHCGCVNLSLAARAVKSTGRIQALQLSQLSLSLQDCDNNTPCLWLPNTGCCHWLAQSVSDARVDNISGNCKIGAILYI